MPAPDARKSGDSEIPTLPREPRNRNVKCNGRTVIRYKKDEDGHLKDDPILDANGARQYRPCEAFAANGTDYCTAHGGSTPAAIAAAKRTLSLAADDFAETIKAIANDERLPAETRLKAAAQGLDRIGVRAGVDIALETPGWQKMLQEEFGSGSSTEDDEAEARARDDEAADPGGVIRERVRKLNTRKANPPAVAPTPPVQETKPKAPRKAPARKAEPPRAKADW